MRSLFARALVIAVLPLCAGVAQDAPSPPTYHNEALHFDLLYPASFTPNPQVAAAMTADARARASDTQQETAACVTTPFAAERHLPTGIEALVITTIDLECLKEPADKPLDSAYLGNLAQGSLRQGLSAFPGATISAPVAYTLGLRPAAFVQGSGSSGPARVGYSAVACIAMQRNAVCFTAFTARSGRLGELLSTGIAFLPEAPTPIVPASLLAP